MNKKLITTGNWTPEIINDYYECIEKIALDKFKLKTYPNRIEIINSNQMLEAYSTHAMPVMYNHWRYGKDLVRNKTAYDTGRMNLAFEVVINSNPCIAYLMEENSIPMQALVIAHACFGHNSFFKNNYLFKNWTEADFINDYLLFARNYVEKCEELYGAEEVETFLDACHALELYGIDKYKRKRQQSEIEAEKQRLENILFTNKNYDDVIHQTTRSNKNDIVDDLTIDNSLKSFSSMEPEENVLYFLEKNAPYLHQWQRELIRIVRKVSQYFYPQRQTKLMNEGWATFMHYNIINELYDKGLVDEGFMLEILEIHSSVIAQPTYRHPYYNKIGINVYSLGFNMFMDIKRICENPTEEDKQYFPDFAGNPDWISVCTYAMENFRDESFVLQYLSPRLIRKYKLFAFKNEKESKYYEISAIHNHKGYSKIREKLSKMFNFSENVPDIYVKNVELKTRTLNLIHNSNNKMFLDKVQTERTLNYLKTIWKFDVKLESVCNGQIYQTFKV